MSDVKRYTIDQDYSALIEEGGEWYRASDVDDLRKRLAAAERTTRAGCTKPLPDPCDEREPINNCGCHACNSPNALIAALEAASEHIGKTPHGDNCYLSNHYDGDPGNRCNCGKEAVLDLIDSAMQEASHG